MVKMNNVFCFVLLIFVILIGLNGIEKAFGQNRERTSVNSELKKRKIEFKRMLKAKEGVVPPETLARAKKLGQKSRRLYGKGQYTKSERLLEKAIAILKQPSELRTKEKGPSHKEQLNEDKARRNQKKRSEEHAISNKINYNSQLVFKDSPFGIHDPIIRRGVKIKRPGFVPSFLPDINSSIDLGVNWIWPCAPPVFPSDWTIWEAYYNMYRKTAINIVPTINLGEVDDGGGMGLSPLKYYESIGNLVTYFKNINYWTLSVEADLRSSRGHAKGQFTPENYALYTRLTYKALKNARTTAKLGLAGTSDNIESYKGEGFFCAGSLGN